MKKQKEEIDKLFSKGLSNFEESPSVDAWAQIESQLPSGKSRMVYWIAASFAGVLLSAAIGWNTILNKSKVPVYDTQELATNANYPQKEFVPVPILIQTKTIVYIDRPIQSIPQNEKIENQYVADESTPVQSIVTQASYEFHPVGATYSLATDTRIPIQGDNDVTSASNNVDPAVTIVYKKGDPKYPKLARALNFMKEVGEGERQLIDFEKISNNLIARKESNNNSNKN